MNAQETWKAAYRKWKKAIHTFSAFYAADEANDKMERFKREAALERIIARQQREIEAQAARISELEAESNEAWQNPFLMSGDELDRAERQARIK